MNYKIVPVFLLLVCFVLSISAGEWKNASALDKKAGKKSVQVKTVTASAERSVFTYAVPEGEVTQTEGTDQLLTLGNAVQQVRTGEPTVPVIPVHFIIPAGRMIEQINVVGSKLVEMPGKHVIEFGQKPYPLLPNAKAKPTTPKKEIYQSDNAYPSKRYEFVTVQKKHGVSIAIITLNPVEYHPLSGRLNYFSELKLEIVTEPQKTVSVSGNVFPRRFDAESMGVENEEALAGYTETSDGPVKLAICDPEDSYQYVLVTSEEMRDATTDYTVNDLVARRQSMGISATITTIEDILAQYTGVDDAEKLRNFIIDAYTNWETQYVLLGGDIDVVPMRKLYTVAYSGGTTDAIPSDLYYQCLDGTYNSDGDSYWGETTDGDDGGDVDLMSEIYIGRASAEDPEEMSNFVYKTIKYETDAETSSYLHTALMCGEYLGFGGVAEYAKESMEEIRLGADTHGYTTAGFASSSTITVNTLYEADADWTATDIIALFNSDQYSIINHLGHANTNYVMMFYNDDADGLTNSNPFFTYSQGCYPGNFEGDCVAEHLITSTRSGCYGGVLNSRYGWGQYSSTDGPSQRFDRQFWDAYFSEYMFTLGEMNADSHEDNLWDITGDCIRWCYVETNLLCDPLTRMRGMVVGPSVAYNSYSIDDNAANNNGIAEPGEQLKLPVSLSNNGSDPATSVTAVLSTTDQYITVTDNSAAYGDIACCGTVVSSADNFSVTVAPDCPTPHTVVMTLAITDAAANSWESTFSLTINSVSVISGYVRSNTGSVPIADASVFYSGSSNGSVTTNAEGAYTLPVIDGTYLLHVESDDYLSTTPVEVTTPPATALDFSLFRPAISLTPTVMKEILSPGATATIDLQIANSGDIELEFALTPVDRSATSIVLPKDLYPASHFEPLDRDEGDTRIGLPVKTLSGGPDLFGYKWTDSRDSGGPAFVWDDISGTGTVLSGVTGCLDCYTSVDLSFDFEFYGNSYSTVYVSTKGNVMFGSGSYQWTNYPLPSTSAPANMIAAFWDDLSTSGQGAVYFQDFGNRAVIQFDDIAPYSGTGSFTFQIVLYENGKINFYYSNMDGTVTSCTAGIQNETQDDGLTIVYNSDFIENSLAVEISAAPLWLTVSTESGTCQAGQSSPVEVTFDATVLPEGEYSGRIIVAHNDPMVDTDIEIPCSLTVAQSIEPPEITEQPQSVTIPEEDIAQFTVTATGGALSYQWSKNGTVIPGATSSTYETAPVTLADNGAEFVCEVGNTAGSVTSNPAILTVIQLPPQIITQPQNQIVNNGESVQFVVEASGSGLMYQWRKNGVAITGATLPEYEIASTIMSDNGAVFSCVVSNQAGSVISDDAVLTVVQTNNYQLQLISIGNSTAATVKGTNYTATDITVGSNASGVVEGTRFRLFLK